MTSQRHNQYTLFPTIVGNQRYICFIHSNHMKPLIISIILYYYLYPRMKQEYQQRGWSWKHYYDVCGDDGRLSYYKWLVRIHRRRGGM